MRYTTKFNVPMFITSTLAGALSWFPCGMVYTLLKEQIARPLLIGLIFGIFVLITALAVFAVSVATGTFEKDLVTGGDSGRAIGILAIILVLLMGLAALFQWLYSLRGGVKGGDPTAYVFLIDDSGSMSTNDPDQLRYDAINDVLDEVDEDFPYMIYSFSDKVTLLREMQPVSVGAADLTYPDNGGQTAIRGVLERALSDYEDGVWKGGRLPKVVLLSDGLPTDFTQYSDLEDTLESYSDNGIIISTVGLGDADEPLMTWIANSTGGVYVDIDDASRLGEAMSSAAVLSMQDDLLTTRVSGGNLGVLWGFLRVLFLTVLGVAIGLTLGVAYGQLDSMQLILVSSIVKSLIGALLLELFTSAFPFHTSDVIFWFILWVLIACTLCTKKVAFTREPTAPRRPAPPKRYGRGNRNVSGF